MKKFVFLLIGLTLQIICYSQELSSDEKILLDNLNYDYSIEKSKVSLNYAWLLYRSGEENSFRKADTVLRKVISLQDHYFESFTYGQ